MKKSATTKNGLNPAFHGFSWRRILLVLALTLSYASAAEITPAEATINRVVTTYDFKLLFPSDELCTNVETGGAIKVNQQESFATTSDILTETSLVGIEIDITSGDESIIVPTPTKVSSGWSNSSPPQRLAQNWSSFRLKTKKAGTTNITFSTVIPNSRTLGIAAVLVKVQQVKVIECNYRMTMLFKGKIGPLGFIGSMRNGRLRIDAESKTVTGSGDFPLLARYLVMPPNCTQINYARTTHTAQVTGKYDQPKLNLVFSFQKGPSSVHAVCFGKAGDSGIFALDPGFALQNASIPIPDRGTSSVSVITKSPGVNGTVTITLKPIRSSP